MWLHHIRGWCLKFAASRFVRYPTMCNSAFTLHHHAWWLGWGRDLSQASSPFSRGVERRVGGGCMLPRLISLVS